MEQPISKDLNLFKKLGAQTDLIHTPPPTTLWSLFRQGQDGPRSTGVNQVGPRS